MTDVIRSVLFVDFDNVFFSLQSADKAAAKSFADDPRRWLDAIESGALIENMPGSPFAGRRRILMRRCYANPAVMRYFRSYFTRSGFQIVDCPPLTGRGKNSADIYMVVDMLDALKHETRFDEFIILSGDADFTPVLLRLRAYDRMSIIYSNAVTAAAYKSLCDGMITEERLIDLTSVESDLDEAQATASLAVVGSPSYSAPVIVGGPATPAARAELPERIGDRAPELVQERGRSQERRRPAVPKPALEAVETVVLVDQLGRPVKIAPELAALARRINASTNVPMFASDIYAALFRALAAEVHDHGFSFNRTVNAVIRRLGEAGLKVRPQHIAFVVKGLMLSGHAFVEADTAASLAKGFRRQVLYLCASEDMTLSEAERGAVGLWIVGGLKNLSESEIMTSDPIASDASVAAEVAGVDPDAERDDSLRLEASEDDDAAFSAAGDDDIGSGDVMAVEIGQAEASDAAVGDDRPDEGAANAAFADAAQAPKLAPDIDGLLARIRSSAR